jgi:polysaccharide export outer membrane protein
MVNGLSTSLAPFRLGLLLVLCCLSLTALGGCTGSRGGQIPYSAEGFGPPDGPSVASIDAAYRIAPLDKLAISVFQVTQLSGSYQVDLTGRIGMPLLGSVAAANKTPDELQQHITDLLSEKLLKNPEVTVGLTEATGSRVTVDGSVKRPGIFPMFGKTTLLQAIAIAGGPDDFANPKRVAIFREIGGKRMAAAFDLTTIRDGQDDDPQVYRGDVIVVDGSTRKRALRDVLSALPLGSLFVPVL